MLIQMFHKITAYLRRRRWAKIIAYYKKCHTYEIHYSERLFGWPFYDSGYKCKGSDPIHALRRAASHADRCNKIASICRPVPQYRYTTEKWAGAEVIDMDTRIIYYVRW